MLHTLYDSFKIVYFVGFSSFIEQYMAGLLYLGLGTHLFVKVPRPRDSEMTFSIFESSCHLFLPV